LTCWPRALAPPHPLQEVFKGVDPAALAAATEHGASSRGGQAKAVAQPLQQAGRQQKAAPAPGSLAAKLAAEKAKRAGGGASAGGLPRCAGPPVATSQLLPVLAGWQRITRAQAALAQQLLHPIISTLCPTGLRASRRCTRGSTTTTRCR
jgi:hypothetical protein